MAILQMQRINIYALSKHCKDILETLQRAGVMQVEKLDVSDNVFYKEDTSAQQSAYKRNASTLSQAREILTSYIPSKKSFLSEVKGRIPISEKEYSNRSQNYSSALQSAYSIIRNDKMICENKAKIINLESKIESLFPWVNLDVPLKKSSTKYTTSFLGTFAQRLDYSTLREMIAKADAQLESFDFEIVSADDNQTCVFAMCLLSTHDRFLSALRKMGFVISGYNFDKTANEIIKNYKDEIDRLEFSISQCIEKIKLNSAKAQDLMFFEDYFIMKAEQYAQVENASYTPHTFVMTGYIPKRNAHGLAKILYDKFDAQIELQDAHGEDVPVVLSNNKFSEPAQSIVMSYSPPNRKELDPTEIMALFYYIFFGMMFSDAGYGLVMALGCFVADKVFKNMETALRRSVKLFFWCGVSTFFWGLMFGSFFGDAVRVIANNFFGVDAPEIAGITVPIWFNPTEGAGPTKLLMFSFLLGIIHLFTGLTIQGINYIRNGNFMYAVYDDLSWIILVTGAVLALLSTEMLGSMTGFMLPPVWLTIGGIMSLAGGVLILFCSARNRNPFKRLVKGAYNLYGITGYLSDVLSYSRLLALGLATGVVAQVFNQLGSMFGSGVLGGVGFAAVFVVGHSLNIGINALGAYVHTNRLQFVEFFGKFYEGGGREFTPYSVKTKYYNIKEEI